MQAQLHASVAARLIKQLELVVLVLASFTDHHGVAACILVRIEERALRWLAITASAPNLLKVPLRIGFELLIVLSSAQSKQATRVSVTCCLEQCTEQTSHGSVCYVYMWITGGPYASMMLMAKQQPGAGTHACAHLYAAGQAPVHNKADIGLVNAHAKRNCCHNDLCFACTSTRPVKKCMHGPGSICPQHCAHQANCNGQHIRPIAIGSSDLRCEHPWQ